MAALRGPDAGARQRDGGVLRGTDAADARAAGDTDGAGIRLGGEKGNDVSYLVSVDSADDVIAKIEEITSRD